MTLLFFCNLSDYPGRPQLNPTPLRSRSPHTPKAPTSASQTNSAAANTFASLHNLADSSGHRHRADSHTSTASNATSLGSCGACDWYKETKASELRKKTALLNRIATKQQLADPIYTRAHPVHSQLIGREPSRRRLFAKRSERYDPDASICSTGSSSSSSNATTTNHSSFNTSKTR